MTVADIITRVRERLDDDSGASSQRYTTDDLTEYAYDGARYYVACVGNQYSQVQIVAQAYQQMYELPCDFIQVERVLWNSDGTYLPLEPTSTRTLDEQVYQWQQVTDTSARSYYRFSTRHIGLWPMPTEDGERYIVHYQQDVADDVSAVALEDHACLVDYVLARCLLSDGKAAEGAERYTAYYDAVKAASNRLKNMSKLWSVSGLNRTMR